VDGGLKTAVIFHAPSFDITGSTLSLVRLSNGQNASVATYRYLPNSIIAVDPVNPHVLSGSAGCANLGEIQR